MAADGRRRDGVNLPTHGPCGWAGDGRTGGTHDEAERLAGRHAAGRRDRPERSRRPRLRPTPHPHPPDAARVQASPPVGGNRRRVAERPAATAPGTGRGSTGAPRQFYALAARQIRRELLDLARQHYGPEGIGANHDTDSGIAAEKKTAPADEPHDLDGWTRFHEQVEKLSDEQREVFDLLWYEGLTQPEAATVLNVSLKTVKRRWQDARLFLFEAMRGESPE